MSNQSTLEITDDRDEGSVTEISRIIFNFGDPTVPSHQFRINVDHGYLDEEKDELTDTSTTGWFTLLDAVALRDFLIAALPL